MTADQLKLLGRAGLDHYAHAIGFHYRYRCFWWNELALRDDIDEVIGEARFAAGPQHRDGDAAGARG